MKIEGNPSNCEECYFLRDGKSPQASCARMGSYIAETKVCLTGPLISKPATPEGWVKLINLAQRNGILVNFKEITK